MELCRTWIPRLPNLKAVIFEIIPDYLASKDMCLDILLAQLEAIREIWNVRGSRLDFTRPDSKHATDDIACGLPPQCEWYAALAMAVNRRAPSPDSAVTWLNAPSIGGLQQIVTNDSKNVVSGRRLTV